MITSRKSPCKDGTSNLPTPSVLCSANGEELICVFNELHIELVSRLSCLLGNYEEAQDAAQEAFLKCWRNRKGIIRVRNLRAWIFQIGLNAARDLLRSAWRRRARRLSGLSTLVEAPTACPVKSAQEKE